MPPWNWSAFAPLSGVSSLVPFFGRPTVFDKTGTGLNSNSMFWDETHTIEIPDFPPIPILQIFYSFTCHDPAAPPLDPGGNPFTLKIVGDIFVGGPVGFEIAANFEGFFFEPAYDVDFVLPLTIFLEPLLFPFDGDITFAPVIWDHPEFPA